MYYVFRDNVSKFRLANSISNKSIELIGIQRAFNIAHNEPNKNIILANNKHITFINDVHSFDDIVLDILEINHSVINDGGTIYSSMNYFVSYWHSW